MRVHRYVSLTVLLPLLVLAITPDAEAHVSGGVTKTVGNVRVQFATRPGAPIRSEPAVLVFSVQDLAGNNLMDVRATLQVSRNDRTVFEAGSKIYPIGDFHVNYTFPEAGDYAVLLTIERGSARPAFEFTVTVWFDFVTVFLFSSPLLVTFLIVLAAIVVGGYVNMRRSTPRLAPD